MKDSLESFWLDDVSSFIDREELVGSLAAFTVLRDIYIRLPSLLNAKDYGSPPTALIDLLPSSLESLHLSHVGNAHLLVLLPQLETLVLQSRARMPRFAKLVMEGYFFETAYFFENLLCRSSTELNIHRRTERLRSVCIATGIEFRIYLSGSLHN